MTLHTWNKAESHSVTLTSCLATLGSGDVLLLLEDGVYAALDQDFLLHFAVCRRAGARLCALAEDLAARGISARISPVADVVGYTGFVALSLQHQQVVNWS